MPSPRLSPAERVLAWLVCGPVGHFAAGLLDGLELLLRLAWARARRPGPSAGRRS